MFEFLKESFKAFLAGFLPITIIMISYMSTYYIEFWGGILFLFSFPFAIYILIRLLK